LQGIWLFISELAGKDLDFMSILKFLVFYSPKIIPLVLPLSILLASIMTFGSFAENYEFAAMKSSGISLQRALRVLTIFIIGLSILAFIFANNIIPKAEFKFLTLRTSIAQQKPSMLIASGQFSDIGDLYNIKVEKKYGDEGTLLEDVTIHKKIKYGNVMVVIKAKKGEIVASEESNFLQLILYDGNYYEDIIPSNFKDRNRQPFAKSSFKKYIINFDLKPLNKTDNNAVVSTNNMLNINELNYTLDSLKRTKIKNVEAYQNNMLGRYSYYLSKSKENIKPSNSVQRENKNSPKDTVFSIKNNEQNIGLDSLSLHKDSIPDTQNIRKADPESRLKILEIAKSNTLNIKYTLESSKSDLAARTKNINEHEIALYDKFVVAYACLLLFFIGAPLGAIIRKGGLGLPIVFAVVIFIAFHFTNVFGKKLAQESGISTFLGSWMSSILLTPLAIALLYRATNDIGLFDSNAFFGNLKNRFLKILIKNKNTNEDAENSTEHD
jgi:lipopolysaccharide export system permease protein